MSYISEQLNHTLDEFESDNLGLLEKNNILDEYSSFIYSNINLLKYKL